jgi:hypothetical protein
VTISGRRRFAARSSWFWLGDCGAVKDAKPPALERESQEVIEIRVASFGLVENKPAYVVWMSIETGFAVAVLTRVVFGLLFTGDWMPLETWMLSS